MSITVNYDEDAYFLTVRSTDTVASLKVLMKEEADISPDDYVLVYNGQSLEPEEGTLESFDIEDEAIVNIVENSSESFWSEISDFFF